LAFARGLSHQWPNEWDRDKRNLNYYLLIVQENVIKNKNMKGKRINKRKGGAFKKADWGNI
jgi:hypothetical protein